MNNQDQHGGNEPAHPNKANKPPIYKNESGTFFVDDEVETIVVSQQPLIERLLSPESIQRLMLVGGGLLVAGFLVWLRVWTVFKDPLVVAAAIGMLITAIIGSGISLVRLWIPAALFCAVYAAIARVTRNPLFIHTLVGGVVMTGMLFLADQSVNQFWNIIPQVTFLVSVGWISVFSSLLFPKENEKNVVGWPNWNADWNL